MIAADHKIERGTIATSGESRISSPVFEEFSGFRRPTWFAPPGN